MSAPREPSSRASAGGSPSSDREAEDSNLQLSPSSTLVDSAPSSTGPSFRHRPTFARSASVLDGNEQRYSTVKTHEDDITDVSSHDEEETTSGLGITLTKDSNDSRHGSLSSISRVPVGSKRSTQELPPVPGTADPPLTPPSANARQGTFPRSASRHTSGEPNSPYWTGNHKAKGSVSSFQSSSHQSYIHSDTEPLRSKPTFTESLRSVYNDFSPSASCPTQKHFYQGRGNWSSVTLSISSVYSTIFSCIYSIIASRGPRYGHIIHTGGSLTASTASLLSALFAKTIELSFVTVFVAFLGQVLSRRAFMRRERGVTSSELNMRSWIMQPGTMLTHFDIIRHSAVSFSGVLSLFAAITAMLYTTASDALVQPQLRFGDSEHKSMQGNVKSSFANPGYLAAQCQTPIEGDNAVEADGETQNTGGTTCMQIQYAGQSFHNYQKYLSDWAAIAGFGNGSKDLSQRPQGFALLYQNTTVTGPWVDIVDTALASQQYGRIINNVSLAFPHAGVVTAAQDQHNGISQPEDLDGLGVYNLHASVPSPVVDVLCVNMSKEELAPIVYEAWHPNSAFNITAFQTSPLIPPGTYTNTTAVDDIFGWGEQYELTPPVFAKYPLEYNTILNATQYAYGRHTIYLLSSGTTSDVYALCSLQARQTPHCSTRYNASSSGATSEAICEQKDDDMQYIRSSKNASSGASTSSPDYINIAEEWANSLSLGAGVSDGNASNARSLSQFISSEPELSPQLPSTAEALAVLAGSTLLMSTQDTPFVEFWNYTAKGNYMTVGQYQYFNATIRAQQYASGAKSGYQNGFYVVLVAVFAINIIVLVYFLSHKGLVTDFSEPPNSFSSAVNSPPSNVMAGSCGGGPEGRQYRTPWFVSAHGDHLFMENVADGDPPVPIATGREQFQSSDSPVRRMFENLSKRRSML